MRVVVIEIQQGTIEERILRILLETYPITLEDIQWELGISEGRLMRAIKGLQLRRILEVEELPDRTFVRLLRRDFAFVGRKATQKKRFKRKGKKLEEKEYEGIMFG